MSDTPLFTIGKGNPFAPKEPDAPETPSAEAVVTTPETPKPSALEAIVGEELKIPGSVVPPVEPVAETAAPAAEEIIPPEDPEAPSPDGDETPEEFKNVYQTLGNYMKEDKILGEDVEIPENATGEQVYELFKQSNRERLQAEVVDRTRAEFMQSMNSIGANEKTLQIAMALEAGTDPALLYENTAYDRYATMKPDETSIDKQQEIIKVGLVMGGLPAEKADKYIDALLIEGDDAITEEFVDQQSKFKVKHDAFLAQESQRALVKSEVDKQMREHRSSIYERVITEGKVKGEPLSPTQIEDLQNSLHGEDAEINIDGTLYRGSKFQKFLNEDLKDFETQLYVYNLLNNREETLNAIKEKAKQEASRDFLSGLPTEVEFEDSEARATLKNKKGKNGKKGLLDFGRSVYSN